MTTPEITYAKHLTASPAHYPQLAKGQPCEKGETAARSGCVPAEGGGGQQTRRAVVRLPKPSVAHVDSRGVPAIDHDKYQEWAAQQPDNDLRSIIKDAKEAIEANPDNPKNSYYADEIAYAGMELSKREKPLREAAEAKESQPAPAGGGEEWTKDRVRAEEARSESPQAAQKASDSAEGKWLPKIRTLDHLIKAGWTIENEAASLERENAEKIKAGRFDQIDFDEIVRVNSETLFIRNWMKEHKEKTGGLGDYEPDQIPLSPLVSYPSRIMGS